MRILFAGQSYRPARNGAAVFSIGLAEGLAAAGHEVAVLMPSDRGRAYQAEYGGVRIYALSALPLAPFYPEIHIALRPQGEVRRLLDALQPAVVHIQDHYPLSRAVALAARARGVALVGTNNFLPGNLIPQLPFRASRSVIERLLWAMVLEVMGRADVVTAVSETSAAILRRQGLRVPVRAISAGVDLRRFAPDLALDRADVRRRYGLDPGRVLFLYVGRVDRDKRLDVLLWALASVRRADVQLAVAGQGRALPALTALAGQLGLRERAVFVGYVPQEDLVPLLNSADVFAMPSEVELQSIATLEAMATGRPVLAANACALPELVHDGANGYLFRAGDAASAASCMERLCDERPRWPTMGAQSLALARGHAIERTIACYEQLYREVAGTGSIGSEQTERPR